MATGPTLAELGRRLGVSAMTVSRALNGQQGISEATRRKILRCASKAGYRPNLVARSLASGKTMLLGAVLRSIGHPQTALVVQGIEEEAVSEGYGLLLYITRGEDEIERRHLDAVGAKRVDGLILYPASQRWDLPDPNRNAVRSVKALGIPVLTVMRPMKGVDVPAFVPDYAGAAELAANRLFSLGHRRIMCLTITTQTCFDVREHIEGISRAARARGLPFDPAEDVVSDQFGEFAAFRGKIARREHTGVVCYSDQMAFGAMGALRRTGLSVPREVSLVGMNDDPIAGQCDPPITTVALPFQEMGRATARALICGGETEGKRMAGRLVERGTAAPPAGV